MVSEYVDNFYSLAHLSGQLSPQADVVTKQTLVVQFCSGLFSQIAQHIVISLSLSGDADLDT